VERRLRPARPHASEGRARIHAPSTELRGASRPPAPSPPRKRRRTPGVLLFTRWILPAVIIVAGLVALSFGTLDALYGGSTLIAAGIAVWLISWAYRYGLSSDDERDAEARARAYFERFGRWPDER
jgi:hypothetical protein